MAQITPLTREMTGPAPGIDADGVDWAATMQRVAARRDVSAFMLVFDHFGPRLNRFLMGRGLAQDRAEDIVQETMIRVWNNAASFDPRLATLGTWVFRIARNLHVDLLRRDRVHGETGDFWDQLDLEAGTAPVVSPESFADHRELDRAIDTLPAEQARLVRMSYLEARSHSEIAQELSLPLGTVKSSIRRAFARLKNTLVTA